MLVTTRGAVTKRIVLVSLAIAMTLTFFTGCGMTGNETTAPEASDQSTMAVSGEDSQTPEVRDALPADLLSDELNVFSDVSFPAGYTVYATGFDNNFYELYLTAQGKPEDIITYVSNLLGDVAEESIRENIDAFYSDGGVFVYGTQVEGGLNADCGIEAAKEDDYDYEYVEGCTLRLRAEVDDPYSYEKIIEDNYNLNSLSEVAGFFDLMPITGKSKIYVRKNHNNAQIDAVYNNVEDVGGLMEDMKATLNYENFDENINIMNLLSYGDISNNVFFDLKNNSICIFQGLSDSGKNYKDYKTATSKLTDLGFQNFIEKEALCEFKDDANNLRISINIQQWGNRPDEWENSCVMFLKEINGYLLVIWYYPDEHHYVVQADKDDSSARYEYFEETGKFDGERPDADTVKAQFEDVYRGLSVGNIYMEGIELFKGYVNDTFAMSIDELYALAETEQLRK